MASTLKGAASTSKGKAERVRVDAGDAIAHANAEPAEPQAASESKGPPGRTTTPTGRSRTRHPRSIDPPRQLGPAPEPDARKKYEKNFPPVLPLVALACREQRLSRDHAAAGRDGRQGEGHSGTGQNAFWRGSKQSREKMAHRLGRTKFVTPTLQRYLFGHPSLAPRCRLCTRHHWGGRTTVRKVAAMSCLPQQVQLLPHPSQATDIAAADYANSARLGNGRRSGVLRD